MPGRAKTNNHLCGHGCKSVHNMNLNLRVCIIPLLADVTQEALSLAFAAMTTPLESTDASHKVGSSMNRWYWFYSSSTHRVCTIYWLFMESMTSIYSMAWCIASHEWFRWLSIHKTAWRHPSHHALGILVMFSRVFLAKASKNFCVEVSIIRECVKCWRVSCRTVTSSSVAQLGMNVCVKYADNENMTNCWLNMLILKQSGEFIFKGCNWALIFSGCDVFILEITSPVYL